MGLLRYSTPSLLALYWIYFITEFTGSRVFSRYAQLVSHCATLFKRGWGVPRTAGEEGGIHGQMGRTRENPKQLGKRG